MMLRRMYLQCRQPPSFSRTVPYKISFFYISVSELLGEEFEKQALGVLEKTEAGLNKFGMDKHNIVSIMLSMVSLS
jgi:hypothetical protein